MAKDGSEYVKLLQNKAGASEYSNMGLDLGIFPGIFNHHFPAGLRNVLPINIGEKYQFYAPSRGHRNTVCVTRGSSCLEGYPGREEIARSSKRPRRKSKTCLAD